MPKITTETYRKFICDNKDFFNQDGTIPINNMRQLIADNFGSNYLTIRSHLRNLIDFRLIFLHGSNSLMLNKDEFCDLFKPSIEPKV